jgi:hypothetical protein
MTTIGYGEMVPKTHLGRLVATLACIWGVFLLSMFVVALITSIDLEDGEIKVYEKINQGIETKKKIMGIGIKLIQRYWRLYLLLRNEKSIFIRLKARRDFLLYVRKFRLAR